MAEQNSMSGLEMLAMIVSAAIVLGSVIYWITQIKGAMDMLKLAYG